MQTEKANIRVIGSSDGAILGVAGDNYRVIISGEQTNGTYAVFDMLVPPGGGPMPHSHPDIQEFFYIVDGELTYKTEAGHVTVKKGGFVHVPYGGVIHCFHNDSNKMAQVLCTVMPAGMEQVFETLGEPVKAGEFLPPPGLTPELVEKLKILNDKFNQIVYPPDYLD